MTLPASKVSPLEEWRVMSCVGIPRISDAEISRKYFSLGETVRRSAVASMMQRHRTEVRVVTRGSRIVFQSNLGNPQTLSVI